jgi:hypothetical protein
MMITGDTKISVDAWANVPYKHYENEEAQEKDRKNAKSLRNRWRWLSRDAIRNIRESLKGSMDDNPYNALLLDNISCRKRVKYSVKQAYHVRLSITPVITM